MAEQRASTLEIGDIRVTLIPAGCYWWDGGAMFGVVPKTLWSRHREVDDSNRIEARFNCFVIETGNRRLLVETGGGIRHDDTWKKRTRMEQPVVLGEALVRGGFEPESIDTVINTHLHWDHASGNTIEAAGDAGGKALPALPEAKYLMQRGELEHARERHPRDAVSYLPLNYEPLVEAGRVQLLDGSYEAAPGVELQVAPGHNRDMMVVIVKSGGATWCHLADLAPYAAQVAPTWVAAFDLYPLQTIATKQELLGRAAAEGWWLSFGHDPKVSFAKIEVLEGKWQLQQTRP